MDQESIDKFNGSIPKPGPALSRKVNEDFDESETDLSWLNFEDVEQLPNEEPQRVIEGLLHIGEKLGITAGSKSFKTWLLLYLAYCIANGFPFLGFKTNQMKVVVFDLELTRWGLQKRLRRIQKEMGKGDFRNLKIVALRGKVRKFCNNIHHLQEQLITDGFKVVIIDPVYKFLLGKEENSNGIVADVLENLTTFCMEAGVACIYVHHHSKGDQSGKNSLDRGSGAGAWSRDPDSVLDLIEHDESVKEARIYTAEITVREFPPIEKFVVRWDFPLLVRDEEGLDPDDLKKPNKGGRPSNDADEKVLIALRTAELIAGLPGLGISELKTVTSVNRRSLYRAIKRLSKKIVKAPLIKGFQLSVEERQKLDTATDEEENCES